MTKEEFIEKARRKHGEVYDYSLVEENDVRNNVNVPIKCGKHGLFWETPYMHLNGLICGCFECYKEENWPREQRD